jgi:endonuclease/exonuclease/phosphatase family metal-dependent hydrolase
VQIIYLNTWYAELRSPLACFLSDNITNTDIFCFQESDKRVRRFCRSILTNFQELAADKKLPNNEVFSQAIYIKNDIAVTGADVLLKDLPDAGLAIHADLDYNGSKFAICNTHGISYDSTDDKLDTPGRIKQSRAILDNYRHAERPVVIGGDFNALPEADCIKMFTRAGYQDLIHDYRIPTTRNVNIWKLYPNTPQYFSDYVFVGKGLKTESFMVPNDIISDHQPLIVNVSFLESTQTKPPMATVLPQSQSSQRSNAIQVQ